MLSDSQIDRYARQIVLPEIGGRGQERLLAATVAIRGGGDAAAVAASYLAGAGVGTLDLSDIGAGAAVARVLGFGGQDPARAVAARNPDCRISTGLSSPSLVVWVGTPVPDDLPADAAVLWGGADDSTLLLVYFTRGTACGACLNTAAPLASAAGESAVALGALVAVEALRVLLGLAADVRPTLLRVAMSGGASSGEPFRGRTDCPRCQSKQEKR
ncbi:MAG: ThiF family adenylyltransferase [Candidatus Binatia bacterium]